MTESTDDRFERMSERFQRERYDRLPLKRLLEEIGLRPGMTVLDFGCGPGGFTFPAAELVAPGIVHALDIVPLAAKKITARARRQGYDNVRTITSDGPTGLDEGTVDAVLLFDVLHDLEPPRPILDELVRILAPDGVLAVEDHHLEDAELINRVESQGSFVFQRRTSYAHLFALRRSLSAGDPGDEEC